MIAYVPIRFSSPGCLLSAHGIGDHSSGGRDVHDTVIASLRSSSGARSDLKLSGRNGSAYMRPIRSGIVCKIQDQHEERGCDHSTNLRELVRYKPFYGIFIKFSRINNTKNRIQIFNLKTQKLSCILLSCPLFPARKVLASSKTCGSSSWRLLPSKWSSPY